MMMHEAMVWKAFLKCGRASMSLFECETSFSAQPRAMLMAAPDIHEIGQRRKLRGDIRGLLEELEQAPAERRAELGSRQMPGSSLPVLADCAREGLVEACRKLLATYPGTSQACDSKNKIDPIF